MNITKQKCEQCGKEVDDWTAEPGWIHITAGECQYVRIQLQRDRETITKDERIFDFCSLSCFTEWVMVWLK